MFVLEKTPDAIVDFSPPFVQQIVKFMEDNDDVQTRYSVDISGWNLTFMRTEATEETKTEDKIPVYLNTEKISAYFNGAAKTRKGTSFLYITRWDQEAPNAGRRTPPKRQSPAMEEQLEICFRVVRGNPPPPSGPRD